MEQKQEGNVGLNSDTELSNARITPPLVGLNNLIKDGLEKVADWIEAPHMKELSEVIDILEKNPIIKNAITGKLQNEMWNTACEGLIGTLEDNDPDYANMYMSLMIRYLKGGGEFQKFLHSERAHEALLDCVKENLKSGWVEHCKKFIPLVRSSLQIGKDINSESVLGIGFNTLVERFDHFHSDRDYFSPESWANDYLNVLKKFGVRERYIRDMVNSPEILDRCESRLIDLLTDQEEITWYGFDDVIRFMQDQHVSTENIGNVANSETLTDVCQRTLAWSISDLEFRWNLDMIMSDIKTYIRKETVNKIMNSEEVRNACESSLFRYNGSEVLDCMRSGDICDENIDKIVINALQKAFEIDLSEVNVYSDDGRVDYTKALNACKDGLIRLGTGLEWYEYDPDFFSSLEVFKELGASKEAIVACLTDDLFNNEVINSVQRFNDDDIYYYKFKNSLKGLDVSEEFINGKSKNIINSDEGVKACEKKVKEIISFHDKNYGEKTYRNFMSLIWNIGASEETIKKLEKFYGELLTIK